MVKRKVEIGHQGFGLKHVNSIPNLRELWNLGDNLILMERIKKIWLGTTGYCEIHIKIHMYMCVPKHHTLLENQVPPGCN